MKSSQCKNGGLADYYKILSLLYLLIAVFNSINHLIGGHGNLHRILYSVPFFIFSILMASKYRKETDLLIDMLITSILVIISPMGDLSAVGFIILVVYRLRKKFDYAAVSALVLLSICLGAVFGEWRIPEIFAVITGYLFLNFKYYNIIHLPTQALKQRIAELEEKLSHYGPSGELTASEIKIRYPFMNDRRIKDLRALAAGSTAKDLQYDNGVSYSNQSKDLRKMMNKFGKIAEVEIKTATHLVVVAVKCGIVPVNFITSGTGPDRW